jgi:hypothetical protein
MMRKMECVIRLVAIGNVGSMGSVRAAIAFLEKHQRANEQRAYA